MDIEQLLHAHMERARRGDRMEVFVDGSRWVPLPDPYPDGLVYLLRHGCIRAAVEFGS